MRKERGGFLKQAVQGVHVFKVRVFLRCPLPPLPCFISLPLLSPAFLWILSPEVGWEKPGQDTHWAVLATVDRCPVPGTPGVAPRDGSAPFSFWLSIPVLGNPPPPPWLLLQAPPLRWMILHLSEDSGQRPGVTLPPPPESNPPAVSPESSPNASASHALDCDLTTTPWPGTSGLPAGLGAAPCSECTAGQGVVC